MNRRANPTAPATGRSPRAGAIGDVADGIAVHRSTIGCVVVARDDEDSIAAVMGSLFGQTRVPDVIHVVIGDSSDATARIASQFAGPHHVVTGVGRQFTEVFVHEIGATTDGSAQALDYGRTLAEGYDHLIAVDGETVADVRSVERLEAAAIAGSDGVAFLRGARPGARGPRMRWLRRVDVLVGTVVRIASIALLATTASLFFALVRRPQESKV